MYLVESNVYRDLIFDEYFCFVIVVSTLFCHCCEHNCCVDVCLLRTVMIRLFVRPRRTFELGKSSFLFDDSGVSNIIRIIYSLI